MTTPTPDVFVWSEPSAPPAVIRVRDPQNITYWKYTHWADPATRPYVSLWSDDTTDGPADPRWVAAEWTDAAGAAMPVQPNEDGQLHGWKWARLLEHAGTLTDVTQPGDRARHWRTDNLPVPAVGPTNAAHAFETTVWKLAGLPTREFTVAAVQTELAIRSHAWVSERLDRLAAGVDRITGVVVRRVAGPNGNGIYEIRHWAAADRP